jgi:hypothetical protein
MCWSSKHQKLWEQELARWQQEDEPLEVKAEDREEEPEVIEQQERERELAEV